LRRPRLTIVVGGMDEVTAALTTEVEPFEIDCAAPGTIVLVMKAPVSLLLYPVEPDVLAPEGVEVALIWDMMVELKLAVMLFNLLRIQAYVSEFLYLCFQKLNERPLLELGRITGLRI
jgi:hypothetical protein